MKKVRKLKLRDKFELWMAIHGIWYGDVLWIIAALLAFGTLLYFTVNQ